MDGKNCWYKRAPAGAWIAGIWQAWSIDHEEYESGPGMFPAAIVIDNATLDTKTVPAEFVSFATVPPNQR